MSREELGSVLGVAAIVVSVRLMTGRWLLEIITSNLPDLL